MTKATIKKRSVCIKDHQKIHVGRRADSENLGFLPGDMVEKISPYLRPLYDALYDMMEARKVEELTAGFSVVVDSGIGSLTPSIDIKYLNNSDIELRQPIDSGQNCDKEHDDNAPSFHQCSRPCHQHARPSR